MADPIPGAGGLPPPGFAVIATCPARFGDLGVGDVGCACGIEGVIVDVAAGVDDRVSAARLPRIAAARVSRLRDHRPQVGT
jgi:hypothetical protein